MQRSTDNLTSGAIKAIVLGNRIPYLSRQAAFFFNTPHFGAGLAEWAVLSATQVGLLRGETAQSINWSPWKEEFSGLTLMQEIFRKYCQRGSLGSRVAGCFATSPLPNSSLVCTNSTSRSETVRKSNADWDDSGLVSRMGAISGIQGDLH
jgi:hypothetical protein